MILIVHGAWDSRQDRTCGVSVLADKIRAQNLSKNVREIDVNEPITFGPIELTEEPNVWLGFSNGGDVVLSAYLDLLSRTEDTTVTSLQAHFVFLDFVYRGARQVFDRWPIQLPSSVQSCLCFLRTRLAGPVPPYHSYIAKADGDKFRNISVDADHPGVPASLDVQNQVCARIAEIFA